MTNASTHLLDVEVGCHGEILGEEGPVNQLDRSQDRRAFFIRLDLFERGHDALVGARRHHAFQGVQAVLRIAGLVRGVVEPKRMKKGIA